MRKPLFFAALMALLPLAHAQHKHVHGEGRLDVTIEGNRISLALELPLDAAALYVPTPAANRTLQSKTAQVPFTGGDDKHGHHAHEGETHHADIEATHVFTCANPAALKGIETTLFKSFKRLYRLEVRRSGPTGQGAARLTPKRPLLGW
jgi:hypothetical protein